MTFRYAMKSLYLAFRAVFLVPLRAPSLPKRPDPAMITSILAMRIDRIGDVVVSLPALKALKDMFPHAHLAVMIRAENAPLIKSVPFINEVIPYYDFAGALKKLHAEKFSIAVDLLMDYTLKTAMLAYLSRAKVTAGFDIGGRGGLFTIPVRPTEEKKKMAEHLLDLVSAIGAKFGFGEDAAGYSDPRLFVSEEDKNFADTFLKDLIARKRVIVAMHPGGYYPSQRWPRERFAQVAETIAQKYHAGIVILGSHAERDIVDYMALLVGVEAVTAIGLPLDKVAAIISSANLFIGNNSGLLHIAAALGKPTVSMMGPTDPALWWPIGVYNLVIRKDLSCSPCNKGVCDKHDCMKFISVEEVLRAVDILMRKILK
ncbi:MAG: lipopolysaccharide heptosyltransferase II [Candidatus Omnitrophica bacterium]|nr:lipopolysaccharide heptosyltransferase II [Candidatus Omnitrophota bacterium]